MTSAPPSTTRCRSSSGSRSTQALPHDRQGLEAGEEDRAHDAQKTLTITDAVHRAGQGRWADKLSFNQAMVVFTDTAKELFEKVPELRALTFVGRWKDQDVVKIGLDRTQYQAINIGDIEEQIGQLHGRAFLELSTGKGSDAQVRQGQHAADGRHLQEDARAAQRACLGLSDAEVDGAPRYIVVFVCLGLASLSSELRAQRSLTSRPSVAAGAEARHRRQATRRSRRASAASPPRARAPSRARRRHRRRRRPASTSAATAASASAPTAAGTRATPPTSSRTARGSKRRPTSSSTSTTRATSAAIRTSVGASCSCRRSPAAICSTTRATSTSHLAIRNAYAETREPRARRAALVGRLAHVPRRRHLPVRLLAARQSEHRRRRRHATSTHRSKSRCRPGSTGSTISISTRRWRRRRAGSGRPDASTVLDRPRFVASLKLHAAASADFPAPRSRSTASCTRCPPVHRDRPDHAAARQALPSRPRLGRRRAARRLAAAVRLREPLVARRRRAGGLRRADRADGDRSDALGRPGAREIVGALSGNWESKLHRRHGRRLRAPLQRRVDERLQPATATPRASSRCGRSIYWNEYFHTAVELSYQARQADGVDFVANRVLSPQVFRFSVMPLVAPMGRGTYIAPADLSHLHGVGDERRRAHRAV